MKLLMVLIYSLLYLKAFANERDFIEGEPSWHSSLHHWECAMIYNDHLRSPNTGYGRGFGYQPNDFSCAKLERLQIIEFAEELLGAVGAGGRRGLLNHNLNDGSWRDSRYFGELIRAVAIKNILMKHQQILGTPMQSISEDKCYQFRGGIRNINLSQ